MPMSAWRKRARVLLRRISAAERRPTPTTPPMATRPVGPIHSLSTANLKKNRAPSRKAAAPTRVSQVRPRCSSSEGAGADAAAGAGAGADAAAGADAGAGADAAAGAGAGADAAAGADAGAG